MSILLATVSAPPTGRFRRCRIKPRFGGRGTSIAFGSLALAASPVAAAPAASPWSRLAVQDLRAAHAIMRDNYPGIVDPGNLQPRHWLEDGLRQSLREAAGARDFADYRRALRRYLNGFRDLHVGVNTVSPLGPSVWPGFIVQSDDDGTARVRLAEPATGVPLDAELIGCDGQSLDALLRARVDPYFYNNDIPHMRRIFYNRLFYLPAMDTWRLRTCSFRGHGSAISVPLKWGATSDADFQARSAKASAQSPLPRTGLKLLDGVWYLSIRTFSAFDPERENKDLQALVDDIRNNASVLRQAPKIVIDLRDNPGGNSDWGVKIAGALWGDDLIDALEASPEMQQTVEFRASPANLAIYQSYSVNPNMSQDARDYYAVAVRDIQAALSEHRPLARSTYGDSNAGPATTRPAVPTPLKGRVYALTRGCGSACLDFLDLVLPIPGVTQIGLPTFADAIYTETSGEVALPSGLASISYALKKITRKRGHNQWYDPKIRWSGGPMSEDRLAAWVKSLP